MKRDEAAKARVIPVKIRPIDNWQGQPFSELQSLPINGEPVTSRVWSRQDDAFVDIVGSIRLVVEDIEQDLQQQQLIRDQKIAAMLETIKTFIASQSNVKIIRTFGVAISLILVAVLLSFCKPSSQMQIEKLLIQGRNKLENSDYQGSVQDYTKAIKIDSKNLDAYMGRGNALYNLEDYQAAIKDYTQALQISPKNINAYIKRGHARFYLKNYQAAIDDYTKAIQISPESVVAYKNRAFVYWQLQNRQAAIKDYQKAAAIYKKQGATGNQKKVLDKLQQLQQKKPRSSNRIYLPNYQIG